MTVNLGQQNNEKNNESFEIMTNDNIDLIAYNSEPNLSWLCMRGC